MMLAELWHPSGGPSLRIAVLGSCRVHAPLRTLVNNDGGRFLWYRFNAFTHAPSETEQYIAYCLGQRSLPVEFAPYIFRQDTLPPVDPRAAEIFATVDIVLAELCSFRFLKVGDTSLQADYFAQLFVRGHGLAVMNWWRSVSQGDDGRDDATDAALVSLEEAGQLTPVAETILRGARMGAIDAEGLDAAVNDFRRYAPHWMFVSHFDPGEDRRATYGSRIHDAALLHDAARRAGQQMFDPSPLIHQTGRDQALANGGADNFHYAPEFDAKLGLHLRDRLFQAARGYVPDPNGGTGQA